MILARGILRTNELII